MTANQTIDARSDDKPDVIIMAGGSVNERLRHLGLRAQTPALLPIHTRPLAAYLLDFYLGEKVGTVYLAVQSEHLSAVETDLIRYRGRFRIIPLPPTGGVVESLRIALAVIPQGSRTCIVNIVTTIPTALAQSGDLLMDSRPTDRSIISAILPNPEGPVLYLKNEERPDAAQAFTGIFALPTDELRRSAGAASRIDDLLAVVRAATVRWNCRAVTWIDCGHEVNFYDARARLISSRSFNRIVVDQDSGIVRKRSQAGAKLRDEADYLVQLPADTSIFFPRLVSAYQESAGMGEYAMEYYGYPNVAEYLLYWDLSPALWQRMFAQFAVVLRRFASHRAPVSTAAYEDFYVRRTDRRIDDFLRGVDSDNPVRRLAAGQMTVNGAPVRSLESLLPEVQSLALSSAVDGGSGGIMHGDFCFNNILYDVSSGIVRLIDARGSFGPVPGIYGDQRYDLAKLMHSATGRYDMIVNGLYELTVDSKGVSYSLGQRAACASCESAMRELLVDLQADERTIRALMGLLFITMPPLHADDRARQITFFAHGLRILTDTLT